MKAELDALILMAETTAQDVLVNGAQALYDMLGLNESLLSFMKNVVQMGLHATDIAGAAVLKGMAAVNSFDVHALPMSAAAMTLGMIKSITDKFIQKLLDQYGIYAQIDETHCEGMIPIRDLGNDYYDFDEKNYMIIGRRHHTKYQLGDPIRIQVARANLERKQLDFTLADD